MENPSHEFTVSVLIFTLNEEENISHVLPEIPDWVHEIILVDGNSVDNTVSLAKELRPEIHVYYQPKTGKDDAMRFGIEKATGDIIVLLDADGATNPQEIPLFLEPLLNGYDFVKGSRFLTSTPVGMPWFRKIGNWVLAMETNILFGTRFTDVCSGYNAFWRDKWANVVLPKEFCYEPLIILRVKKAGLKIKEVASIDQGRIYGSSKLSNWKQGWGAFSGILKERFNG